MERRPGSGIAIMSDSSTRANPSMLLPSNPLPFLERLLQLLRP